MGIAVMNRDEGMMTMVPDAAGVAVDVHSWLTQDQQQQTAKHPEMTNLAPDSPSLLPSLDYT